MDCQEAAGPALVAKLSEMLPVYIIKCERTYGCSMWLFVTFSGGNGVGKIFLLLVTCECHRQRGGAAAPYGLMLSESQHQSARSRADSSRFL